MSRASRVRTRFAWTYSTAGMKRPWRKTFGQAFASWRTSRSSRPLRVSSSKAAEASAVRIRRERPPADGPAPDRQLDGTSSIPSRRARSRRASEGGEVESVLLAGALRRVVRERLLEEGRHPADPQAPGIATGRSRRRAGRPPSDRGRRRRGSASSTRAVSSAERARGPDLVQGPGERHHAGAAHPAEGRAQAGDAAAGRGGDDRAVGLGAEGERTRPAATAAAEPADEPLEPCSGFHGLRVLPPNQTSPQARAPTESLATSTAPASSRRRTTVASSSHHLVAERARRPRWSGSRPPPSGPWRPRACRGGAPASGRRRSPGRPARPGPTPGRAPPGG